MDPDVLARYTQKVADYCGGIDPYTLTNAKDPLPSNIHYFDICNYCIGKDSAYTHQSFKAYKSLEAFRLYESGWVQSVACKKTSNGYILLARAKHSYSISLTPLKCWVAVDKDGVILTGHCNCMAGLGEVCSHVAAVLFLLEDWGRKSNDIHNSESISCTDVLSKWLVPATKNVEMARVNDIVWGNNTSSIEEVSVVSVDAIDSSLNPNAFFSDSLQRLEDDEPTEDTELAEDTELTEEEIDKFIKKIHEKGVFCPIMAMRDPFSKYFVEKSSKELLQELATDEDELNISVIHLYLISLFKIEYEDLSIEDLREIGSDITLSYTQDEIEYIEDKTRDQSSCKLWYRFRTGRVRSSVFKNVCRTSIMSPSIYIIERICYPERHIFESKQTDYGKRNESVARETYAAGLRLTHTHFSVELSGFIINNNYPFCGASPDAITTCDCCGKGIAEIKCPWTLRNGKLDAYLKKRYCPLDWVENDDGTWKYVLKEGHEYYYQVQMQMFVTNSEFCDFVVWEPSTSIVIRVFKDEPFWQEQYPKASDFFQKVLLPELLGNYYTQKKESFST